MYFLLLILVWCVPVWAAERLYIVQYADESLAEIDLANGNVNSHVLDLGYGCNDILATDSRLYVTNSLLNTIQEINAESNQTLREIPVEGALNPYSTALLNSDTLAVTNWLSNNMLLIRLSDGTVVDNITCGIAPEGILASDHRVFVCLTRYLSFGNFGPGVVMVYDRRTLNLLDSIQVGTNPQFMAEDEQARLHVVCTGNYDDVQGSVYVVNLATLQIDSILQVGGSPSNISIGGGYAFVAAGGWADEGYVMKYRINDLSIINSAASPLTVGIGATDVEAMPDGTFFVSCSMEDIVEYRLATGSLIHSYEVSDGPGQMTLYHSPSNTGNHPNLPLPVTPRLSSAYPNPFNGSVTIRFDQTLTRSVNIIFYNILGDIVDQLLVHPGSTAVQWLPARVPASGLSTGIYWAKISDGHSIRPIKLIYVK